MTYRKMLAEGSRLFAEAGLETPYLDALVLLSHSAGMDKAKLFASFTDEAAEEVKETYDEAVRRRLSGLPVSYILKSKEFYGLPFFVDERVLVPRPDTETLVETALAVIEKDPAVRRAHDACTGTGCIPIAVLSARREERRIDYSVSDLSEDALEVFRVNSLRLLGRMLPHRRSDLLDGVEGPFDLITANPPYLTEAEADALDKKGWPEPRLALDGGKDGLDLVRRLAGQAVERLEENGYLILEGADPEADEILSILEKCGFKQLGTVRDLAGKRRVTVGRRGPGAHAQNG